MIFGYIGSGIKQVASCKRMLIPFYLANLFFGLMIMLPLAYALDDFTGNSMMRGELGSAMDYNFLFEFLHYADSGVSGVTGMIPTVPAIYWLVALFLSGGALAVFARGERYSPAAFWGGAATFFGRFLRLTLMAIPVLAILFSIRYLESFLEWLFFGSDPYEYVIYWGAWIKMGLGYIGLILFGLVFDYARIHMVLSDNRKARVSLWRGIKFAAGNPVKTFTLAFSLFVLGWVALYIYSIISNMLSGSGWTVVILLFILQQLYIIFRLGLRLTFYSSQMEMYMRLKH